MVKMQGGVFGAVAELEGLDRGPAMTRRAYVHRLADGRARRRLRARGGDRVGRDRARARRRDFRQDRGQRLRQRFFARLRDARAEGCAARRRAPTRPSVCIVMSGGTEGALCARISLVFEARESTKPARRGRVGGRARAHARSRPSISAGSPRSISSPRASRRRCATPGIARRRDVHFVQIKCPLLTAERVAEAERRGADDGDARHVEVDGPFARRLGARRRGRARRDSRAQPRRGGDRARLRRSIPGAPRPRPASN